MAVEFSVATPLRLHARGCAAARVPLLVGTTGIDASPRRQLVACGAKTIAVLIAPNTSIGVAVLHQLVAAATAS